MTGRDPRPGDRVLIRGTFVRRMDYKIGGVSVTVDGRSTELIVPMSTVAEVLDPDPEWFPPQDEDTVLDRDGRAWQYVEYDDGSGQWHCVLGADFDTDELLDQFWPVTLVARGGKPVGP